MNSSIGGYPSNITPLTIFLQHVDVAETLGSAPVWRMDDIIEISNSFRNYIARDHRIWLAKAVWVVGGMLKLSLLPTLLYFFIIPYLHSVLGYVHDLLGEFTSTCKSKT